MPQHKPTEFWTSVLWTRDPSPGALLEQAIGMEAEGWDGVSVADTQCLMPEVFVLLSAIALRTTRIRIAPGVMVPLTRHPAVVASGMAAVQALSGGRASVMIGRGDSALAFIGASPVRLAAFERFVTQCRRYLAGEMLPLDEVVPRGHDAVPGFEHIAMGTPPPGSALLWLDPAVPRVPVEVVATGPKALEMGGRIADRVALNVGVDPARVAWAIETVRAGARKAGRDPASIGISLFCTLLPSAGDGAKERELVRPFVLANSRYAIHDREVRGHVSTHQRDVLAKMMDSYDVSQHARAHEGPSVADDAFVDSYAIVGSPDACVERLLGLQTLGVDRFNLTMTTPDRPDYDAIRRLVLDEVIAVCRPAMG